MDYREPIVLECDAEVREFCIGVLEGHGGERSIMLAKYKDGRVMVVRDVSNGYMAEIFSSYKNVTNCYNLFFFDWCWAIREGGEDEWTVVDDLSELRE